MAFKKILIVFFLIFFIFPISEILSQTPNTGFVSGNIWYSKDSFEEGDKIKIYTFIFNPDARELSGTVIFFDKNVLLGKKNFTIGGKTANDVSIDWTATAGDHTIFGKIENSKFLILKGKYEEVYLAENETEKSSRTVPKKIISKIKESIKEDSASSSADIKKIIEEQTPDFIAKPAVLFANTLEQFRENISSSSENKKEKINNDIKAINDKNIGQEIKSKNLLLKPFKYVQLFFLSIGLFIFKSKILFYGILAIIVFFLLRFVWKKVF